MTGAVKRYPCFGSVSIQALPSSPRAFRSADIWKERLASSTNTSDQSACINSRLESTRPLFSASSTSRSKVFGGSVTPALVHFVEATELSDDALEELRQILDRKQEDAQR